MIFQILLVTVLIGFAIFLIRMPGLSRGRRILILTMVAVMLVFSIRPDWSTDVAKLLGISRGVDLLFYISHLTLFWLAFVSFLKLKRLESRMTKLVQQLALAPGRGERLGRNEPNLASGDDRAPGGLPNGEPLQQ